MSISGDQNVTLLNLREQIIAGRFRLLRPIRRGGHAQIWIADNMAPRAGEPSLVAVKVLYLDPHEQIDPQLQAILSDNIKLEDYSLRQLEHPHIVKLFESGDTADERTGRRFYYLVLELLEGGDVYQLCRGKPLNLDDALIYAGQVCSALTCAHESGIIHRDIKPNNLLLTKDRDAVKTLDFGTASVLDKQNGAITRVGTEVYAAPESYSPANRTIVTPAADVYSLAKVLLFMLTGNSPSYLAQKQITYLPAELRAEPWADSLLSALAKATCDDPSCRYQSAAEFCNALRQVLELTEIAVGACHPNERREYYPRPSFTRFEVPVPNSITGAAALPLNAFARTPHARGLTGIFREAWLNIPTQLTFQVLVVIAIVLILLVGLPSVLRLRDGNAPARPAQTARDLIIGKEGFASTDVNIRSGPSADHSRIGLAENQSRVRILSHNHDRTWYEIQVVEHSRAKQDPNSSDRGWVRSKFLTLN